jgi:branched-chain amino acid aminotransferase
VIPTGTLVYIDGRRVSQDEAKISVFDRGLLYGDSVFETIATHSGRPFMLVEHIQRLRHSAELVYIDLPVDDATLCAEVETAVAESTNSECYLRLIVTRGVGGLGLDPGLSEGPCRILIVAPLNRPSSEAYENGVSAISYRTQRTAESTEASGAKVGNYLVAVLAMRQAKPTHANEALIVNGEDRVVEGATSNLFVRFAQELITPPESAGILPGITRQLVLEVAKRSGITVGYRCPTLSELASADEIIITSSVREILPVVKLDGSRVGDGKPGPYYRQVRAGYFALVQEELAQAPRFFRAVTPK